MPLDADTVNAGIDNGISSILDRYDDADDINSALIGNFDDFDIDEDIGDFFQNYAASRNAYFANQYERKEASEEEHYVRQAVGDFALEASAKGLKALGDTSVVITNTVKAIVTETISYEQAIVDYFDGQPVKIYVEKLTGVYVRSETILSETTHIPIGKAIAGAGKAVSGWAIYENYKDAIASAYQAATNPGDIEQGLETVRDLIKAGTIVIGGASAAMLIVGSATSMAGLAVTAVAGAAAAAAFDAATTGIGNALLSAYNLSKTVEQALEDAKEAINQAVDEVWDSVGSAAEDFLEQGQTAFEDVLGGIGDLLPSLPSLPGGGDGPLGIPLPPWFPKIGLPWGNGEDASPPQTSPIILDLGASGIDLAAVNTVGSVYWDIDNDDFSEASDWVGPEDGILSIDLNSDGVINNHSELFGTATTNGYTILDGYDTNNDNYITSADTQFEDLLVWIDANSDGISQAGELHTLTDLGITSIRTTYDNVNYTIDGVLVKQQSDFTINGQTRTSVDAWFEFDSSNAEYRGSYDLDVRTLFLPTLRGFGDLRDLHIAMSEDEDLLEMVQDIAVADLENLFDPAFDLRGKIEDMLIKWAGAENVDPEGRGGHFDGQHLAVLEKLMGRLFDAVGEVEVDPHTNAGFHLQQAWEGLLSTATGQILGQTAGSGLFSEQGAYNPVIGQFEGDYVVNFGALEDLVTEIDPQALDLFSFWRGVIDLFDITIGISNFAPADWDELDGLIKDSMPVATIGLESFVNSIHINPQDTWPATHNFNGDGNDNIFYSSNGNLNLYGQAGNDVIFSGYGQYNGHGGEGDDTYILLKGFGVSSYQNYINENVGEGTDTVWLSGGILPEEVLLWTDSYGRLQLQIGDVTSDSFSLAGSIGASGIDVHTRLERIIFDSGLIWELSDGLELYLPNLNSLYVYGTSLNDTFYAGNQNQSMYGYGGNDTYVFNPSFGSDVVYEEIDSGMDTIRFVGISASDIRLYTDTNGWLYLEDKNNYLNKVTIQAGYSGGQYQSTVGEYVEQVVFDDMTTWDLTGGLIIEGTDSYYETYYGTVFNDSIYGLGGMDILYGNGGNDALYGGSGSDQLYGGVGNDTYYFSSGFGQDFVSEQTSEGTDTIRFAGISASDIRLYTDTNGWLYLEDKNSYLNKVTIQAGYSGGQYQSTVGEYVEQVVFDDTTTWDLTGGLTIEGSSSSESLYGTAFGDNISGLDGNDYLYGNDGNDILYGGAGIDYLYGGNGADNLYGGAGADNLTGGAGADKFMFDSGTAYSNVDTITDFNTGEGDALDLVSLLGAYDPLNDLITDFVEMTTSGSDTAVKVDQDGTGSTYGWTQIATLTGVTGLTDEAALVTSGNLIVA